jgi:hypothetical protein
VLQDAASQGEATGFRLDVHAFDLSRVGGDQAPAAACDSAGAAVQARDDEETARWGEVAGGGVVGFVGEAVQGELFGVQALSEAQDFGMAVGDGGQQGHDSGR